MKFDDKFEASELASAARNGVSAADEPKVDWGLDLCGTDKNATESVVELRADEIRPGIFSLRDDANWDSASYKRLMNDIRLQGRNCVPISVRELPTDFPGGYEIITGHRRHRACLELGLSVRAIVCVRSDQDAIRDMITENASRKSLAPIENGRLLKKALAENIWPSNREAERHVGFGYSQIGKLVKLASLPQEVIEAFPSPIQIQTNWGKRLADAVARDPEGITRRALEIFRDRKLKKAADVFEALAPATQGADSASKHVITIEENGQFRAEIEVDLRTSSSQIIVRIVRGAIELAELESGLRKMLFGVYQPVRAA